MRKRVDNKIYVIYMTEVDNNKLLGFVNSEREAEKYVNMYNDNPEAYGICDYECLYELI